LSDEIQFERLPFSISRSVAAVIDLHTLAARIEQRKIVRYPFLQLRDRGQTYDVVCSPEMASHVLEAVERVVYTRPDLRAECASTIQTLLNILDSEASAE